MRGVFGLNLLCNLKRHRRPWRFRPEATVGQDVSLLQFTINGLGQGEAIEVKAQGLQFGHLLTTNLGRSQYLIERDLGGAI